MFPTRLLALYRRHFQDARRERLFLASVSFFCAFAIARLATHTLRYWMGTEAGVWIGGTHVHHLVWGIFLRTVFVMHSTWFVNSAAHVWGYKNFETGDDSRNLWWVAALTFGEGWHNNHHAHQRSARHGLRWWEVDVSYGFIRLLSFFGLAKHIHVAPTPKAKEGSRRSVWRVLRPRRNSSLSQM